MMQLRPYQVEAIQAVYDHLRLRDDNPCVVLPTAAGKTPVMATTLGITVRSVAGEKYDRIIKHQLGEKPCAVTVGDLAGGEPDYMNIPEDQIPF